MPTTAAIVRHYEMVGEPICFGCEAPQEAWGDLDRAHLIDRQHDGLDAVQNLILLCPPCHRAMPSFGPGYEDAARAWVAERPHWLARFDAQLPELQVLIDAGHSIDVAARIVTDRWRGR